MGSYVGYLIIFLIVIMLDGVRNKAHYQMDLTPLLIAPQTAYRHDLLSQSKINAKNSPSGKISMEVIPKNKIGAFQKH